ncbi:uncharacterized protein [Rutidosis leptorrhynchoides]|uniref:uncharacterized protein n=1 Tax=Rutidosis leptorrhynchoides TaxID=125765 RepID=UPI003A99991A
MVSIGIKRTHESSIEDILGCKARKKATAVDESQKKSEESVNLCDFTKLLGFVDGIWENPSVISLDRKLSDHSPLLLKNGQEEFGPKPVMIFDVWLNDKGAEEIVVNAWNKPVKAKKLDTIFRLKLKNVKNSLKEWSKTTYGRFNEDIHELGDKCMAWEFEAEYRTLSDHERKEWLDDRGNWLKKDQEKRCMLRQKIRLKWACEGDENTEYFHSMIKRRNSKNNIRGLYINGSWCECPKEIKKEVHRYFKAFYEDTRTCNLSFAGFETEKITDDDASMLEAPFKKEEVWNAIRDCGSSKAPGPDGDLMNALNRFWEDCDISPGCNASLRKVISKIVVKGRSILDSILGGNELVEDVKRRKAKCCV